MQIWDYFLLDAKVARGLGFEETILHSRALHLHWTRPAEKCPPYLKDEELMARLSLPSTVQFYNGEDEPPAPPQRIIVT